MKLGVSAGAIAPRDMTLRQWSSYQADLHARSVRDGQSGYDFGDPGIWYGTDTDGVFKLSLGDPDSNKVTWDGSALAITGALNLTNTIQTFTPNWLGFSSAPSGDLSVLDLGRVVIIWNGTASDMLGTSSSTSLSINNLPSSLQPSAGNRSMQTQIVDNGTLYLGSIVVNNSNLTFHLSAVSGTKLQAQAVGTFTNVGNKGLPDGWIVVYPK